MTQWMSKAVGIDLGTTNSAVAVMSPSDTDTVIHQDPTTKAQTTPSCLWRDRAGKLVVGRKAFARVGSEPRPITSVKRLMGTGRTVELAGVEMTPAEVSAEILREMRSQIEQDVRGFDTATSRWLVDRAVVTVPAYFDQPQVEATREAADRAGLRVVDLLHEPTAAASYHCWKTGVRDGTFLVYDLGGGTFDVSVVRCTAGHFRVLGISGSPVFGGDDLDAALAHRLVEQLRADGWALDLDLVNDPEDELRFRRLRLLAEGAKKALSERTEYMLRDAGTVIDKSGDPVVIDTLMERAELEETIRPLLERTFQYCDEALEHAAREADVTLASIDQVILAGGSTHVPLVREMVAGRLCSGTRAPEPVYERVDTIVALGAAVRAAAVGGLEAYDENRTVRMWLRGSGVTPTEETTVGGTVTALDDGVDLAGGFVQLTVDDHEDEAELTAEGDFSFRRVPVTPDAQSLLAFEVFDAAGTPVAALGRPVAHDAEVGAQGSPVASAINVKPIRMDVMRSGVKAQEELVPAMKPLPFTANFSFSHPGNTDRVEFRLYQQSRPIKVIVAEVPSSTPAGTSISLDVNMDETLLMTVRGSIGTANEFDGLVEAPPLDDMPGETEAAELWRRFDEAAAFLSAGEQSAPRARMKTAERGFREAVANNDVVRAVHEFGQMEDVVASLDRPRVDLRPQKQDFDKLVEECGELNRYLAGQVDKLEVAHDAEEMSRAIAVQRDHGDRAFADGDQRSYSEAIGHLQSYLEHLRGLAVGTFRNQPQPSEEEMARYRLLKALDLAAEMSPLVEAGANDEQRRAFEQSTRRLASLEPLINRDATRVSREASEELQRLEQLKNILISGSGPDDGGVLPQVRG
ncbi:Hsp70 family protein [Streptomyces sp. TS71-3]|uniref:Hsp70 family protein n=1 Tax=Streptomyces sp. TS71-3 TaxID=2733862 RepID=UPI001B0DF991|nr:Hsp70 family protein [Streptomyces sp. TS71-3]GHJ42009.1 hypothetical protein Sm713_76180 [Streptomyces sp. TS71-3]